MTEAWWGSPLRDHRQQNVRCVCRGMMDPVVSGHPRGLVVVVAAGVQVAVEAWEIAARDLDANPMTAAEVVTRGFKVNGHGIDLARLHPHFVCEPLAEPGT